MVADYLENIRDRRPLSNVEPGYLHKLIPDHAPEEPEKWEDLVKDVERVIMPGVSHKKSLFHIPLIIKSKSQIVYLVRMLYIFYHQN